MIMSLLLDIEAEVEIIESFPAWPETFKRLNLEWIERCFTVEPEDEQVLNHPQINILEPGGFIFFARSIKSGEVVGTCALLKMTETHYEIAKMAVTQKARGQKIGKKLMEAVLRKATSSGATHITLESSSKLKAAISMYESFGFQHVTPATPSKYESADVFMELRL